MKTVLTLTLLVACTSARNRINNVRVTDWLVNGLKIVWYDNQQTPETQYNLRYREHATPHHQNAVDDHDHEPAIWHSIETNIDIAQIHSLPRGATYEMQVRARNSNNDQWSNWSPIVLATVHTPGQGPHTPRTPTDFNALAFTPTSLMIEWKDRQNLPASRQEDIYYIVSASRSDIHLDNNDVETTSQSKTWHVRGRYEFMANELVPGAQYRLTIKAALSPTEISNSIAILATLPSAEKFYRVESIEIVSSEKPDAVMIRWATPTDAKRNINYFKAYWQPENRQTDIWQQAIVDNQESSVNLTQLTHNTTYLIKVHTHMKSSETPITSYVFKFTTKAFEAIKNLTITYQTNGDVMIRWSLNDAIAQSQISAYTLLYTDQSDQPDAEWRRQEIVGGEPEATVTDLAYDTDYVLKINTHRSDGHTSFGRMLYRFKTLDSNAVGQMRPTTLTYRALSSNSIIIRWQMPGDTDHEYTGYMVMYSQNRDLDYQNWMKILVSSIEKTSLTLSGLKPATIYYIKILKRHSDGTFDDPNAGVANIFEVKTGEKTDKKSRETESHTLMKNSGVCLSICTDDNKCESGSVCVPTDQETFCVPQRLYDRIRATSTRTMRQAIFT